MKDNLLMIFYRNPELGKVKTRLAATMGEEKALAIYLHLSNHTREVARQVRCARWVFYSNHVDTEDAWENSHFEKRLQRGNDLGERMSNAFEAGFAAGYSKICIIGTDCLELDVRILADAFRQLRDHDAVIGPAEDGGYYLMGMKVLHAAIFRNKQWSSSSVFQDTASDLKTLHLSYALLPTLRDIDEAADLPDEYR